MLKIDLFVESSEIIFEFPDVAFHKLIVKPALLHDHWILSFLIENSLEEGTEDRESFFWVFQKDVDGGVD